MTNDVRTEEKGKSRHRGSGMGGYSRAFRFARMIMILAVITLSVISAGITLADDQPIPSATIGYQLGAITAIYENTLDIEGRNYRLAPDVVMLDEHGEMFDPARLRVSAQVKFHVTKEQSNMIDKMIVTLPK